MTTDEEARRREFACPPATGWLGDIDLSLLDPSDPDERSQLIEAEHPEYHEALEQSLETIDVGGTEVSPRLHLVMHEIVANQLWDDDPPEVWATAKRLTAMRFDRHEVLHMLGSVVAGDLWHALNEQQPFDHARFVAQLDALPDSWEAQRR